MIVELGHFALILALMVAVVQATLPLWGAHRGDARLMALAGPAAGLQLLLIGGAFAALTWAFVVSDFSLAVVVSNSHTLKPMLYKVSGVWGNHEGSLLLWVLILAIYGAAVAAFGGNLPVRLKARVLAVQGLIGVAFMAFLLITSNPFWRLAVPPLDGEDLNPLLQDPGLAFHPPFLYLGYVGLSMAFSFAVAALIEGRVDAAWGRWVRPWTLAAWVFLTIGIALGSWWAYYELGWGGFWFWDPVENASFMPWLLAAALLHSSIVVEKRESLKAWTILLAIMAFGFSLIGTFIVRSGVITSVHAFANDPERGVFILMILGFFTGGALILFALRAGVMEARGVFSLVSRESALIANNILLSVAAFVVFIGTIWPLVGQMLLGRDLSVGEPFFMYLNIWRPKTEEEGLPVYLWIHGGGNNFGAAKLYEGSILAARSNMVVVTINYRLGALGWLNHPALKTGTSKEDDSGNFGLLDAIKALEWVHDNIRGFGGDPGNVTVAGESAGGRNTLSLLISPLAGGLFQRAICESGGMPTISVEDGIKLANSTIEKLLVNDRTVNDAAAAASYREKISGEALAKYLRSKTAAELIQAETNDRGGMYLHSAFEDGYVIPGNLVSVIAAGNYNHVPVIMGSNEYELKSFLPLYGAAIPTSNFHHWVDLYKVLDGRLTLDEVLPSQFDKDLYEACGYYGSRNWKATYLDSIARQLKEKQDDVYCYFFKWGGPGSGPQPYDFIIGAGHATEIPFFFGWPKDTFGYAFTGENRDGRVALQTAMMSYVSQFARTGNPNAEASSLTAWQEWSNDAGAVKCIVFDGTFTQAKIAMMTEELTVEAVQDEIEALPPLIKGMVKLWVRSRTS